MCFSVSHSPKSMNISLAKYTKGNITFEYKYSQSRTTTHQSASCSEQTINSV